MGNISNVRHQVAFIYYILIIYFTGASEISHFILPIIYDWKTPLTIGKSIAGFLGFQASKVTVWHCNHTEYFF